MAKSVKQGKKISSGLLIAIALLVILGFGGGYLLSKYYEEEDIADIASLRGGETRPTLSPAYFTGKAAQAYQIAKEIPEIIDSLYCYCRCKENYGHKSLLTCFIDDHAEHCGVCMDEAIIAYDMFKQGKDILTIRRIIDKEFSR